MELDSLYLRWFDTWLKDKKVNWERQPRVRVFVTGAKIALWDTAHRLEKGRRLGIIIKSEMFPYYARNLNTGEPNSVGFSKGACV